MKLGGQPVAAAIGLAATLDRRLERIERERKASGGRVDGAWLGHAPQLPPGSASTPRIRQPCGRENLTHRQAVGDGILRCLAACRQRSTAFAPSVCEWRASPLPAYLTRRARVLEARASNQLG